MAAYKLRPRASLASIALLVAGAAAADPPPGYWDAASGLSGEALKQALHEIIDDHDARSYGALRDELPVLDEAPDDSDGVFLIYRRASVQENTWPNYNREHLWPQSKGTRRVPARSDAHHVFASDTDVNQRRGSLEFGECETSCSIDAEAPMAESNTSVWEPPPEVKGDIARALFYLTVRYEGVADGDFHGEPDLELVESGSGRGCNCMGRLSTLLEWHVEDDVDESERRRHEAVFEFQGNRNPFIDHPEWVASIWPQTPPDDDDDEPGGDDDDEPGDDDDDEPGDDDDDEPGDDDEHSTTSDVCTACLEALELFATLRATNPLGVPLHQEPRGTNDFTRVADGTSVQVIGAAFDGGWLRVRLQDESEGWISRRYVGEFLE